jgi:hypothetical protein
MSRKRKRRAIKRPIPPPRADLASGSAGFFSRLKKLATQVSVEIDLFLKVHEIRNNLETITRTNPRKPASKTAKRPTPSNNREQALLARHNAWTPKNFWGSQNSFWFLFLLPLTR